MSTTSQRQTGMVIAAAWLIALGLVFLVREMAGWSWGQAWPLWIIFIGVGTGASALLSGHRPASLIWSISWPIAAIVVGFVLLMSTTGQLALAPGELIAWWPVVVIAIGVWFLIGALVAREPGRGSESLTVPLGIASSADVRIKFGAGELTIGPAASGALVSGQFDGGVVHKSGGPGRIELEPESVWPFGWGRPLRWDVGLTTDVPVDLTLETGANRSDIDLGSLRIRSLEVKTGASETRIRLPGKGQTFVRAEAGAASLTMDVPQGVAARIRSQMALGETKVDERRFPRANGGWASPDYDAATDRVDIEVRGGLGSVRVT